MNAVLNVMTDAAWRLATTPSPSPSGVDANDVTPGVWGFVVTFLIAAAVVALIFDMQRRVRRVNYKAEIDERLQEELAQQSGQQGAPGQPKPPLQQDGRIDPDDTTGDSARR